MTGIKVILNSITPGTGAKPFDSEINMFGVHFLKSGGRMPHPEWNGEFGVTEETPNSANVVLKKGTYLVPVSRLTAGANLNYTPYDSFHAHVQVFEDQTIATSGAGIGALILRVTNGSAAVGASNSVFGIDEVSAEFIPHANALAYTDAEIQTAVGTDFFIRVADINTSGGNIAQGNIVEPDYPEIIAPGGVDLADSVIRNVKADPTDDTSVMPRSEVIANISNSQLQPVVDSVVLRNDAILTSDPTVAPTTANSGNTGQDIDNGTWRVKYAWVTNSGSTLYSPEELHVVTGFESFIVTVPDPSADPNIIGTQIAFSYVDGSDTYVGDVVLLPGVTTYEFARREPKVGKGQVMASVPFAPVGTVTIGSTINANHPQGSWEYSYAVITAQGQVSGFSPYSTAVAVGTAAANTMWVTMSNVRPYNSSPTLLQTELGMDAGSTASQMLWRVRVNGGAEHYIITPFITFSVTWHGNGSTSALAENLQYNGENPVDTLDMIPFDYDDYNLEDYVRTIATGNTSNVSLEILNEMFESGNLIVADNTFTVPPDSATLNIGTIGLKTYRLILTVPQ